MQSPHTDYVNGFIIQIVKWKKTQVRCQMFELCPALRSNWSIWRSSRSGHSRNQTEEICLLFLPSCHFYVQQRARVLERWHKTKARCPLVVLILGCSLEWSGDRLTFPMPRPHPKPLDQNIWGVNPDRSIFTALQATPVCRQGCQPLL